jgi:hypothetical protein
MFMVAFLHPFAMMFRLKVTASRMPGLRAGRIPERVPEFR